MERWNNKNRYYVIKVKLLQPWSSNLKDKAKLFYEKTKTNNAVVYLSILSFLSASPKPISSWRLSQISTVIYVTTSVSSYYTFCCLLCLLCHVLTLLSFQIQPFNPALQLSPFPSPDNPCPPAHLFPIYTLSLPDWQVCIRPIAFQPLFCLIDESLPNRFLDKFACSACLPNWFWPLPVFLIKINVNSYLHLSARESCYLSHYEDTVVFSKCYWNMSQ